MKLKIDLTVGLEFSPQTFIISSDDQKAKLEYCDIKPNAYAVSYTHLTLPTNREV